MALEDDIEKVLWTPLQISQRVSELASQLNADFAAPSTSPPPVFIAVVTGAFVFLADLVRLLQFPVLVDFVRVGSYGFGTVSNGSHVIFSDLKIDVSGKHVVLVEDIVDTGSTLSWLISHLKAKGASSVSVCTFLDKPARRTTNFELVGKGKYYWGFKLEEYISGGLPLSYQNSQTLVQPISTLMSLLLRLEQPNVTILQLRCTDSLIAAAVAEFEPIS